jgi:hypothetical protein
MNLLRLLVVLSILCLNFRSAGASWQQEGTSSRREVAVIAAIELAGGRVNKISAADESREISFNLSRKPIGDEQLKEISAVREVIWCNLAGTAITDNGLQYLTGMPLRKLHLERTTIGDDGLRHLKSCQDLEYLNLYGTKITDDGLDHLRGLKKLKQLYVWQTGVTAAGIEKLNQSLPELAIVGEVKLSAKVIEAPASKSPSSDNQDEKSDRSDKTERENAGTKDTQPAVSDADGNTDRQADDKDQAIEQG